MCPLLPLCYISASAYVRKQGGSAKSRDLTEEGSPCDVKSQKKAQESASIHVLQSTDCVYEVYMSYDKNITHSHSPHAGPSVLLL